MLKVGDIVKLNYGGLLMSVCDVEGNKIKCVWLDRKGPRKKIFPSSILKLDLEATSALYNFRVNGARGNF